MIDTLSQFYSAHYNFGIFAVLLLLLAAFLGSKKNLKGVLIVLGVFMVYNMVLYNKCRKEGMDWYSKKESEVKSFDPVKKLWEDKPADDDLNKRK